MFSEDDSSKLGEKRTDQHSGALTPKTAAPFRSVVVGEVGVTVAAPLTVHEQVKPGCRRVRLPYLT